VLLLGYDEAEYFSQEAKWRVREETGGAEAKTGLGPIELEEMKATPPRETRSL